MCIENQLIHRRNFPNLKVYNSYIKFTYWEVSQRTFQHKVFFLWCGSICICMPLTINVSHALSIITILHGSQHMKIQNILNVSILLTSGKLHCVAIVQYMQPSSAAVERVFTNWLFDAIIRAQLQKLIWLSYFSCCECVYILVAFWSLRSKEEQCVYNMAYCTGVKWPFWDQSPPSTQYFKSLLL